MKTEDEVRAMFRELVKQRDGIGRDENPRARDVVNHYATALAWVLEHPDVKSKPSLALAQATIDFMSAFN